MKLLFCHSCYEIFSLSSEEKTCECKKTKGKYIDRLNAVYSGEYAIPLGFKNISFIQALSNQPKNGMGEDFKAFVIPVECESFKKE